MATGGTTVAAVSVLGFWGTALLLIVAPGPDWAYTLGCALQRRSVLAAPAGLTLGYTAMTLVVAAGLGPVLARSPTALTVLSVAGGLYLVWLGGSTLRRHRPRAARARSFGTDRAALLAGVGVSGLNPKALLIFVALLPQFADSSGRWPMTVQLGVLGLVFTATCGVFYLGLGAVARWAFLSRPRRARVLSVVSGGSMVVIGAALVVERLTA